MVPIVIHNAGDVAPKGDFVFRPATVEVDVLPPVDTSDWRAETIDEHVEEVRRMFRETLRYDREIGAPAPDAPSEPAAEVSAPEVPAPEVPAQPPVAGRPLKKKLRKKKASKKVSKKPSPPTQPAATGKKAPRKKPHKKKVGVKTVTGETVQTASKDAGSA
jgi:putative phosphoserine phosphatase/1-acylglycerol-3-phosphate O-acyltransferase